MKSELINLLDRLQNHPGPGNGDNPVEREAFQGLTVFPNGTAHAQYRWGIKQFQNLDQLEALAYPDSVGPVPSPGEPSTPSIPCPRKE